MRRPMQRSADLRVFFEGSVWPIPARNPHTGPPTVPPFGLTEWTQAWNRARRPRAAPAHDSCARSRAAASGGADLAVNGCHAGREGVAGGVVLRPPR